MAKPMGQISILKNDISLEEIKQFVSFLLSKDFNVVITQDEECYCMSWDESNIDNDSWDELNASPIWADLEQRRYIVEDDINTNLSSVSTKQLENEIERRKQSE